VRGVGMSLLGWWGGHGPFVWSWGKVAEYAELDV